MFQSSLIALNGGKVALLLKIKTECINTAQLVVYKAGTKIEIKF